MEDGKRGVISVLLVRLSPDVEHPHSDCKQANAWAARGARGDADHAVLGLSLLKPLLGAGPQSYVLEEECEPLHLALRCAAGLQALPLSKGSQARSPYGRWLAAQAFGISAETD
ncbi:hypothetical protein NDU88_001545 [Pleurodeles waltl]|uniref:Uncharacterized protein n=1 Tax=Pleurodeles waltl TaxID=8319 RepID=A0AAV7P471_PLEWA|nr:hypothetical protein NDU88_001545 [Pleurodeles waltl]